MCTLTLHTGTQGDWITIYIDWFNENNQRLVSELEIVTLEQDKPRTIEIRLKGEVLARLIAGQEGED